MRASIAWPMGVVGVFLVSLGVCGATVYLATGDSSVASEEDYYAKAVSWDETAAELRASEELGWEAAANALDGVLVVSIVDGQGRSVEGATVEAFVFHHAARARAMSVEASEVGSGAYRVPLPSKRRGLWQARLRVTKGDSVFVRTFNVEVEG